MDIRADRRVVVALCLASLLLAGQATAQLGRAATPRGVLRIPKEALEKPPMAATSAGIDSAGKTYVVLYWKKADGVVGYNLYRRKESETAFPAAPVNGAKPIVPVKTCDELKAIVPPGSAEWKMLSNALAPAPTAPKAESSSAPKPAYMVMKGSEILTAASAADKLRPGLIAALHDPCSVFQRGLTDREQALLDAMAAANLKIRLVRGLGFIDSKVAANASYVYELRGVRADGTQTVLAKDVRVQAGHFTLPNPPSGITAMPGDARVLILWNRDLSACTYFVARSTSASGPFQQVHSEPVAYDIEQDLENNDLTPPRPGLVDYQRWSPEGLPVTHEVISSGGATAAIDGPRNATTYYYKVASVDILGRQGAWSSSAASATPTDKTAPSAPDGLRVDPSSSPVGLSLQWRKVTTDALGHQELDSTNTYNIYRSDTLDALDNVAALTPASGLFVHSLSAVPGDAATPTVSWTDTSPVLVPAYGEKDFYYTVQCVDARGNVSAPSAAISGRAPDKTPPGATKVIGAESLSDHIRVFWNPNTEPDVAGYQIYVGVCDMGKPYRPTRGNQKDSPVGPCDFALVGELLKADADKRKAETGSIYFDDYSAAAGSPICYAYWVRAFDAARNVYPGKWSYGCPDTGEYVCQRLYENTAPPPPIIAGLKARNNSVVIEWVSSPIQDLRAFHIYRSARENDPPVFVGCVLSDGTPHPGKWTGIKPKCEDIPADPNPAAVRGSYEDKGVEPNTVCWYRVAAVDWQGNESESADITRIPAVSTFTYNKDLPATPSVSASGPSTPEGCGLAVRWTPAFDPGAHRGFLVFRSTAEAGPYRQISQIVSKNEFLDASAIKGVQYWYRVQTMDKDGNLSQPSAAVAHKY